MLTASAKLLACHSHIFRRRLNLVVLPVEYGSRFLVIMALPKGVDVGKLRSLRRGLAADYVTPVTGFGGTEVVLNAMEDLDLLPSLIRESFPLMPENGNATLTTLVEQCDAAGLNVSLEFGNSNPNDAELRIFISLRQEY